MNGLRNVKAVEMMLQVAVCYFWLALAVTGVR